MTVRNTHQWIGKMAKNTENVMDILSKADAFCQNCKPASLMQCVEQCEIWRTKNEFLQMNGIYGRDEHIHNLLNAIKNSRRKYILDALSKRPHGAKGLQEYLKSNGYQHSQRTILTEYVKPLKETGLVKRDGVKYHLTLYGVKLQQILSKFSIENLLPPHSRCYEEIVLKKLRDGPKSYIELSESLTQKSLSRTLKRLHETGLITRSPNPEYIFYFRTKKVPKKPFSPTEKRVYKSIPERGISAGQLSKMVGINTRRTYKYLRKLRKRRLTFTRKKPRTYSLTSDGTELADFLEETTKLVSDVSKVSNYLLHRSRETQIHRPPQLPPMHSESSLREGDTEKKRLVRGRTSL